MDSIDLDYDLSMDAPFRSRSHTWPVPRPDESLDRLGGEPLEPCPEGLGSCSSFGTLVAGDAEDLRPADPNSFGSQHMHPTHSQQSVLHHSLSNQHPLNSSLGSLHGDLNQSSPSQAPHQAGSVSGPLSSSGERLDDLSEVAELEELGQLDPSLSSSNLNNLDGNVSSFGLNGEQLSPQSALKKNSSRRNAWGNMSYADLITQAIQQSNEQRLTLSQIYEWMVRNVSYFKDKGDSNSSAGWKVSCFFVCYLFKLIGLCKKMSPSFMIGMIDCVALRDQQSTFCRFARNVLSK